MEYNIRQTKNNLENKNVKIIKPSPGPQTEFLKASADIVIYGGSAGGGKLCQLTESVLTANKGWTTVGELELGDVLFDRFGNQCVVMALSEVEMPKQCYRVHFSNGASIVVGAEHLWVTSSLEDREQGKSESVKDTQHIYDTLFVNGETNHSVFVAGALQYKERDVVLDPYYAGEFLSECNIIIEPYLTSSIEQRLAFLQGLMDTIGEANDNGECLLITRADFPTNDILFLIRSLGINPTVIDEHTIKFLTDLPAFRLERKLEKQKRDNFRGTHDVYYITKVEPIDPVPCKCIGVSSPDETYLIGESLIPTHNTFALFLDILRYANYKNFVGVIFRKQMTQVINSGGLWDKALELFKQLGAIPNATSRYLKFPYIKRDKEGKIIEYVESAGGKIQFSHLNNDDDRFNWQGTEVPYIAFDELTHFTFEDFTYLMSRNRNTNGFPNLIRATCNPDPDSWVREILDPWIDRETGFPIPEMSGKVLYMVIENEKFIFSENREELEYDADGNKRFPKSITFIPSKITDNPYLANDASYRASLDAMDEFTRKQLRDGCWSYRPNKGLVFSKDWFEEVTMAQLPEFRKIVRGWDFASGKDKDLSKKQKYDFSASVKLGWGVDGYIYVLDVTKEQLAPADLIPRMMDLAEQDGINCIIRIPQDPGQAGAFQAQQIASKLMKYPVKSRTMQSSKYNRALTVSTKCKAGIYRIMKDDWNKMFLNDLEAYPHDIKSPDIVDALVEAHYEMTEDDTFITSCYTI